MTAIGRRRRGGAAAIAAAAGVLAWSGAAPARAQTEAADRHRIPAAYMSYLGADWLERGERVAEEQPERVLDAMGLRPGDVVADVGCGSGYYARRIARRVQPGGAVYCQDIQPEMLDIMRERAAEEGVTGIEPILGAPDDPRLPAGAIDWIIIADVYHEMSHPEPMLAGIRRALAPGGRVALLEYRVEDGTGDQILADHAMSVRQVLLEWQAAGFELLALHDFLPSQHLFFLRPAGSGGAGGVLADHDLFAARAAGLVEVEARGAGADAVTLRIRRTTDRPLVITSPVATWFTGGGASDMLARRDGWVVLDDNAWRDWTLRAVARLPDRESPSAGQPLEIRPPSAIPRLAALLYEIQAGTYTVADSPTLYPPRTRAIEAAAVWIADADTPYATLEPRFAGSPVPARYAAAIALVFLDRAGIDITRRQIWSAREAIFSRLRDQGLQAWYNLKTTRR